MASTVKGTYILLDRGILEHWLYNDKPFNRSMAWIDMLLIATHTTQKTMWRGQMTEFKRGDVNLSITELAHRWGWSRDKARRFILQLESDGMCTVKRTVNRTVITIVKYDNFQSRRAVNKTVDKATDKTVDKAVDKAQINNVKECNKECKTNIVAPLLDSPVDEDDENDLEKYPWNDPNWFDEVDE